MPSKTLTKKKPSLLRRVANAFLPSDRGLSWETAAKISTAAGLFLVPIVVAPWSADPWEIHKLGVLVVTVAASWVLLLVAVIRRGHDRWHWHPIDIVVLIFGLVVTVSTALSMNWWSSLFGIPGWTSHSLLATWVFIGLYFSVARLFPTAADRRLVWGILLISLAASLMVHMFQLSDVSLLPEPLNQNRWFSTIGNLNIHAVMLAAIFSASLFILWTATAERWERMVLSFGVVLGWLILLLSGRSLGWAVFALGVVAVVIHQSRDQKQLNVKLIMVAIAIAAAGLIAQITNLASLSGLPSYQELTLDQGTTATTTWNTLQDRFVLGSGPATWYDAFVNYRPLSFNQTPVWDIRFAQGASGWLQLLTTVGVAGAALFFGLFFLGMIMAWRGWRNNGDPFLLVTLVVLMAIVVSGFFTIWSLPLLAIGWAALGLARTTVTDWSRVKTAPMPGWGYGLAAFGTLAGLAVVIPFIGVYVSNALTYRAVRQSERNVPVADVVQTLKQARQWDGRNAEASKYLMNAYAQQVRQLVTDKKYDQATTVLNQITALSNEAKRLDPENPQIYEAENQVLNALAYAVSDAAARAQENFSQLRTIELVNPIHDVGYGQTLMASLVVNGQSASPTAEQRTVAITNALAAYQEALKKKPDYFQARLSMMQAYVEAGYAERALAVFPNVTKYSAVEQAYVAVVRGQAYDAMDKPLDAAAAIVAGIGVYSSDASLYISAAEYFIKGEKKDEAKKILERGKTALPNDTSIADKLKTL